MNKIFVLGSGELGHAIITSFLNHPYFKPTAYSLTTTVRASTLSSSSITPSRAAQIDYYRSNNVAIETLDVEALTREELAQKLGPYTTIIHAGGMTLPPGTQMKITQAVLDSTGLSAEKLYIPWQFGLDYDAIGPTAGGGLFKEQCQIRDLLRSQTNVKWVIVSNGIFTSFMFEPFWGVVEPATAASGSSDAKVTVRALGSWEDKLVATTAEDIARCTAELVLVDTEQRGVPVFIAGDLFSYTDLANVVGKVSGKEVHRELWDTPSLERKMEAEPDNKLRKYHVVFSRNIGTNWPMDSTYNAKKGLKMKSVEEFLRANLDIFAKT